MRYPILVYPEDVGGFSVVCPSLPGCHSQAETLEEPLGNMREAIQLYLEVLREDGIELLTVGEPWLT